MLMCEHSYSSTHVHARVRVWRARMHTLPPFFHRPSPVEAVSNTTSDLVPAGCSALMKPRRGASAPPGLRAVNAISRRREPEVVGSSESTLMSTGAVGSGSRPPSANR